MTVKPLTKLGYTLGIRRNVDPRGGNRRTGGEQFSRESGDTRMAGERLNIFDLEPGELKAPYVKGSRIRSRFPSVYPEWARQTDPE